MIKPIGDYVLVEPEKIEDKTESGIILPEMKKDRPQTGIVIDYPIPNPPTQTRHLKPGTKVWFKMWAGEPVKYEGKDYLLIHRKDLIAYEGGEK